MPMRFNHHRQGQSPRGGAMAALLMLLLPIFFPSLFTPLTHGSPSISSEWNSIKPRHAHLLRSALQRTISFQQKLELWTPLPHQGWKPCSDLGLKPILPEKSEGYIQVFLDGGLNQQRMGVCDAVAVAKILNATLVIPHLEINPVWQDSSTFMEIFDVDHFINILKDDVRIVKELPAEFSWSTREYYATAIRDTRIKAAPVHASANWYLENVLPVLRSHGIAAVSPFSHRLDFDNIAVEIQHLRCKVNFQALAFVPYIKALGDSLVSRLRYSSSNNGVVGSNSLREVTNTREKEGAGKFVVLHLRFDKDMAAHSACDFGGGKAEKLALAKYRQVIWQGRVINSQFTDEELRSQGRCPLTPEEIGLLLAALGFDNSTRLYLASHKVYGGEARISALRSLFPLMEDKKSLASSEERAQIRGKASLLAAVDYYVSTQSDVFISASPGNMHNAMVGHRTYHNMKTIRPNMALLGQIFLNKTKSWPDFEAAIVEGHKNRQGRIRLRKAGQSIYTYPLMSAFLFSAMTVAGSVSSVRRAFRTFAVHPAIAIKEDGFKTKAFPLKTPFSCTGLACKHRHWPLRAFAVSMSRTLCKVAQAVSNDMEISPNGVGDKDTIEDVKRIIELAERASSRREVLHSNFLMPPLLKESMQLLQAMADVKCVAQGGYPEAERCRLSVGHPDALKNDPDIVSALSISGNFSFQPCSHGDFLGSLLGTGISRNKVGDIILQGEKGAHVLVVPELVDYIITSLDKVRNVSVACKKIPLLAIEYEPPKTKSFKTVEPSTRLDSIASAGFKMSRSKMAALISNGDVRVNWSTVQKNNTTVKTGDIISVTGKGRLKVGEINTTKKKKYAIELILYV